MSEEAVQAVTNASKSFNEALINRDDKTLNLLTSSGLSYGHSKGKIETQDAFISNLLNEGATQFTSIDIENQTVEIVEDNAIVRHTFKAKTSKNGNVGQLEIRNLMVWKNFADGWKLIARQAFSA